MLRYIFSILLIVSLASCGEIEFPDDAADKTDTEESVDRDGNSGKDDATDGDEEDDTEGDETAGTESEGIYDGIGVLDIAWRDMPEKLSVWDGHVVMSVIPDAEDSDRKTLLLLSKKEWDDVWTDVDGSVEAIDIAAKYSEGKMAGWTVPTEAEAKILYQLYNGNSSECDALLRQVHGKPVTAKDGDKNVTFLCADGTKYFRFTTSTITTVKKTGGYHLRLVRRVEVRGTK